MGFPLTKIRHRYTNAILYEREGDKRDAVVAAVAAGVSLVHANLQAGDLRCAFLSGASLQGALLRYADLEDANLAGASLQGAILQGANLAGANLRGANLRGADLRNAILRGVDLWGADLWGANLKYTYLKGTHLRCALGCMELPVGDPRGYRLIAIEQSDGEWLLYAGCRGPWTVTEARLHWGDENYLGDRDIADRYMHALAGAIGVGCAPYRVVHTTTIK